MNDDARFFFFLSGFFGFVFFYAISLFLNKDLVISLIYGTSGSLVFSFFGRILLASMLKKSRLGVEASKEQVNFGNQDETPANPLPDKNAGTIESSMEANMEAASTSADHFKKIAK